MGKQTHSMMYPRDFEVSRSGAYSRVVLFGRHRNPPHVIDAFVEFNTLDEVRQARDLLTAVLDEGKEPEQPIAVEGYFNVDNDELKRKNASERAAERGLLEAPVEEPPKSQKKKKPPKQQDMFPGM